MPLQKSVLCAEHQALGARLVPFAGWEMPLHYGSQVQEHHAVRRDAGLFDVSHMRAIDVSGAAAGDFLRRLLANDVARLQEDGAALYSCMLREDGGVLDDLLVYRRAAHEFRLVVNAGTAQQDFSWIVRQCAQQDVAIDMRTDLAILALQGPQAREKFWRALPEWRAATEPLRRFCMTQTGGMMVARTGYTGEDGFEILLPAAGATALWQALLAAGFAPCGLGARDTLRLEAGMNLYGQDMDAAVTPLESGLAWTVDRTAPRDFIGRAALAVRPVTQQLLGVLLRDPGVMRAHQPLRGAAGTGELTSGGFAPTLNRSIALARVPVAARPGDAVEIGMRGRWLAAVLVKLPFVRCGSPLPALAVYL
jgi:aminomethyltransferase